MTTSAARRGAGHHLHRHEFDLAGRLGRRLKAPPPPLQPLRRDPPLAPERRPVVSPLASNAASAARPSASLQYRPAANSRSHAWSAPPIFVFFATVTSVAEPPSMPSGSTGAVHRALTLERAWVRPLGRTSVGHLRGSSWIESPARALQHARRWHRLWPWTPTRPEGAALRVEPRQDLIEFRSAGRVHCSEAGRHAEALQFHRAVRFELRHDDRSAGAA